MYLHILGRINHLPFFSLFIFQFILNLTGFVYWDSLSPIDKKHAIFYFLMYFNLIGRRVPDFWKHQVTLWSQGGGYLILCPQIHDNMPLKIYLLNPMKRFMVGQKSGNPSKSLQGLCVWIWNSAQYNGK